VIVLIFLCIEDYSAVSYLGC